MLLHVIEHFLAQDAQATNGFVQGNALFESDLPQFFVFTGNF
jgi:hypothetical protein